MAAGTCTQAPPRKSESLRCCACCKLVQECIRPTRTHATDGAQDGRTGESQGYMLTSTSVMGGQISAAAYGWGSGYQPLPGCCRDHPPPNVSAQKGLHSLRPRCCHMPAELPPIHSPFHFPSIPPGTGC